jgi:hypothetical protein
VQGFRPSHFRCFDRHATQADGIVARSLNSWREMEEAANDVWRSPWLSGRPSELGDRLDDRDTDDAAGVSRGAAEADGGSILLADQDMKCLVDYGTVRYFVCGVRVELMVWSACGPAAVEGPCIYDKPNHCRMICVETLSMQG